MWAELVDTMCTIGPTDKRGGIGFLPQEASILLNLLIGKCSSCHTTELVHSYPFHFFSCKCKYGYDYD